MPSLFPVNINENLRELADINRKLANGIASLNRLRDQDVDIATTPKEEIHRIDKAVLYRFRPEAERLHDVPLMIVYALVGRYTMADLQEDRSFIRNLLRAGLDVYVVDWGMPTRADRWLGFEDYVNTYMDEFMDVIRERHELDKVNLLGICQGGVLSLCYAALHPDKVKNLVVTVTPVDFHADKGSDNIEHGFMNIWARNLTGRDVDLMVDTLGNVPGEFTGVLFSMMTPMRSMTKYNLDLFQMLDDEKKLLNFLRMEKWLADRPDHAGEAARQWLKDLYQDNKLIRNELELDGEKVDLRNITMPVLNVYTKTDHIIPSAMSEVLGRCVGTDDYNEFVVAGGHIGVFVGSKAQRTLASGIADWLGKR
jgi:polyhydroxyalkanoate synthase